MFCLLEDNVYKFSPTKNGISDDSRASQLALGEIHHPSCPNHSSRSLDRWETSPKLSIRRGESQALFSDLLRDRWSNFDSHQYLRSHTEFNGQLEERLDTTGNICIASPWIWIRNCLCLEILKLQIAWIWSFLSVWTVEWPLGTSNLIRLRDAKWIRKVMLNHLACCMFVFNNWSGCIHQTSPSGIRAFWRDFFCVCLLSMIRTDSAAAKAWI